MNTRVFRGKTIDEARRAAADTLGKDPVILTTRSVRRSGLAGFLGGSEVEIAAAAMPDDQPAPRTRSKGPFAASAYLDSPPDPPPDPFTVLRAELRGEIRAIKVALGRPAPAKADRSDELIAEMSAVREALETLSPSSRRNAEGATAVRATGVEGEAAAAILRSMRAKGDETASVEERLRDAVSDAIRVAPWPLVAEGRAVIALVGPTGVGKTTTIAKLAARAKLDGRTLTLVTCDTFRVGGVEQTKRYADLLGAPCEIARNASDLAEILLRARTDLVFVDTSGRSPIADAAERLLASDTFATAAERRSFSRYVLLCVTASIRAVDAGRVADAFSVVDPTGVAITKIDETEAPAGLVHAPLAAKLPISILCSGQRVPEDIAPATMGAVLDALTRKGYAVRGAAA